MELSEAIRLGSAACEQGFGRYVDLSGKRCALGSAALAAGIDRNDVTGLGNQQLIETFWVLRYFENKDGDEIRCPECGHRSALCGTIIHLNDTHEWTRARIADYVEEKEKAAAKQAQFEETEEELCLIAR